MTDEALRRRVAREAAVVVTLTVVFTVVAHLTELSERLLSAVLVGDVVLLLAFSHVLMLVFGARRGRDLKASAAGRKAAEEALRRRADVDATTGVASLAAFVDAVEAAAGCGPDTALLVLDVDRFSAVNDTLGHDVGTAVLVEVAALAAATAPRGSTVGRLGGDHFGILLPAGEADRAHATAERLLAAGRGPVEVGSLVVETQLSIGVVTDRGIGARELVRRADLARLQAKREHTGLATYTPDGDRFDPGQLALVTDLRHALDTGSGLTVHYQPQVDLRSGRVVGVEALVRWQHPDRGPLPPDAFIPLAEQTGLIRPLTDTVLALALTDAAAWRRDGLDLSVAVNLSARVLDGNLPDRLASLLSEHRADPRRLELEVTESSAMEDPVGCALVLHRLRQLGPQLSVDDFGTGHASLAYLARLPLDRLKIDRSFVLGMATDAADATIVRSTVELAHGLGLDVVAEGVETAEHWALLRASGCDVAQGYWLGRPSPADELPGRVAEIEQRLATAELLAGP